MLMVFWVEGVNMIILITNESIMDVLMNFVSLVVLAEFDNFYFNSISKQPVPRLIAEGELQDKDHTIKLAVIMRIQTTSSDYAKARINGNELQGLPERDDH